MANRPVFCAVNGVPFVKTEYVEFQFASGCAVSQKQKNVERLHEMFQVRNPEKKVLEISSKSLAPLGIALSAFNLKVAGDDNRTVECVFHGSKVFENGGPYTDLLDKTSREAKKDERIRNSGKIIGFRYKDVDYPHIPVDFFYNWMYINALHANEQYAKEILEYDAFTDIEFNPLKSQNCQAKACAIYVSLHRAGLLEKALKSKNKFLKIVYSTF